MSTGNRNYSLFSEGVGENSNQNTADTIAVKYSERSMCGFPYILRWHALSEVVVRMNSYRVW